MASNLISCSVFCCSRKSSFFKLFSSTSTLDFIFSDLHVNEITGGESHNHTLKSVKSADGAIIDSNLFKTEISQLIAMGLTTFSLECSAVETEPEEPQNQA